MKITKEVVLTKKLLTKWNDMEILWQIQDGDLVEIIPLESSLPYKKGYMHWEFYAKAIQAALEETRK